MSDEQVLRGELPALLEGGNAHHVGELAIRRQTEGLWPRSKPYRTGRPD